MANENDYISKVYQTLTEKVDGFNRSPEEFRNLMMSDSAYRGRAYQALKDKVEGFNRTPENFNSLVIGEIPKQPKYQKSVQKDRSEAEKFLSTTWNNFVTGFESFATGIPERVPQDPFSYIQPLTGPQKTVSDVVREQVERPKTEAAIKKERTRKIESAFGKIKSDYATPVEQQEISRIDFKNKGFIENAKALTASGARMLSDIPLALVTGMSSYYFQGYGEGVREYDKMVEKGEIKENPLAREVYGNTVGVINSYLEKLGFDKIFGTGPAFKNIQKKVISDTFKKISKSTTPISTKGIEKIIETEVRALASTAKSKGLKVAYSSAIEGITEGIQTTLNEGAKILTNKIQGQEVFNEKEIYDNIGKNILTATLAGGIYGAPMGTIATFSKNVNTSVLKDVANAKTDEDFANIRSELEATFDANNYSQEDRDATMFTLENYARIKQKLPPLTPPEVQEKVIPIVEQRDKVDEEIAAKKEQLSKLDESVAADAESEIKALEEKRASLNDEIRGEVSGVETSYFEADGKFFKQIGDAEPEEISKTRYDIESVRNDDKQLEQDEKDAITVSEMLDMPVLYNGDKATLRVEGQTVVADIPSKNRIVEIGNVDEIGDSKISDLGIEKQESAVSVADSGNIVVRGTEFVNLFTDPLAAINRDANGNIVSVNLETEDGKKRTFRGSTADDVAYQIILKKINENNETRQQFEDFVESNEPIKQELESGQVAEVAVEAAPIITEQVPVVAEIKVGSIVTDADGKEYMVVELGTSRKGTPQATVEIPKRTKEEIEKNARLIVFGRNENRTLYKSENDPKFIKEQDIAISEEISEQTAVNNSSRGTITLDLSDLKLKESEQTSVEPVNEIERLRAAEQKELLAAIPNIEQYKVDGVVDRSKITNEEDRAKFDEIYNKYDKIISPLVKPSETAQPVAGQAVVEADIEVKPTMETGTGLLAPADGKTVKVGEANKGFQNKGIILGEDTTIEMPNGETRDAAFAVVEMDDILASHNETSFNDTKGYPSQNGMNVNPRNYKGDTVAKEKVNRDARNLKPSIVISDSATPDTGVPIISLDGIVLSGNGRTMAIKLSKDIAPEKYAEYKKRLEDRAAKFGIDPAAVRGMKNPVLVKIDNSVKEYSVKELDAYNQKAQKGESPTDTAIKRAAIISNNQRLKDGILNIISGYNTMGELFDSKQDRTALINLLEANGIITQQERSEYVSQDNQLTESGKDLINDILLATVVSPEVMKSTDNVKTFRKNIISALPLLTTNYKNENYSLEKLINDAILLQSDMVSRGYKLDDFWNYIGQTQLGKPHNPDVIVMNRMIAEGPMKFKDFVRKYNAASETSAGGMFESEAMTREQALSALAKTENKLKENEIKIIANLAGVYSEYERAQQAGTAKVFEQPIFEQVTEQEAEELPEFVNGEFTNPKFEEQYQRERASEFGYTETREQFVARKFCK